MSRWSLDEPDFDRYETKPDADLPDDFGTPDPPVDPAEHAAHAVIEALSTFRHQLALAGAAQDFDRGMALWKMLHRMEMDAAQVTNLAASTMDQILERRR